MRVYLEKNELIHPDELLVGISMFSGEVHTSTQDNPVYVHAYVVKATDFEEMKKLVDSEMPLPVRRISIEMHLNEFFGLFKRFEICVSNNGLIDGKEIEVLESTDVE
ncbi:MAG: hypothetical protein CVU73_12745 [Deltaproteobacteria bacterium HGW-Deltaproteobacteria-8]|nr:MAG: hypothetical protein CVU73_12745 [Deltaproteobacteria bacterium HGW-Deltaproteobacteria-8]